MSDFKEETITAENTFTEKHRFKGDFNVSISGIFVGTVTAQRSHDGGTTWNDIQDWIEPVEALACDGSGALYRIGVKSGDYTSGTIKVRLG